MGTSISVDSSIAGAAGTLGAELVARRMRDMTPLMAQVGELHVATMRSNITERAKPGDDNVRTGRTAQSCTVFGYGPSFVEAGSNLVHAAQLHHGGTILPKTGKSLAIPLHGWLKRSGAWPRDYEAVFGRKLTFVPRSRGKLVGLLIDDGAAEGGSQEESQGAGNGKKGKRKFRKKDNGRPMYALFSEVTQTGNKFGEWTPDALKVIREELWPNFLGLK